jgi:transposase
MVCGEQMEERQMVQAITVGLDIAKNVFHAYGVDAAGVKAFSRKLRRSQVEAFFAKLEPCLIGIEACATAHHWARTLETMGHQVRLMPPAYVKPYVKTHKNDEADAEAICEAVGRPNMRFAQIKTVEQQSVLVLHRTRALLIKHRTRMGNTIRAHLAEFGITESIGREGLSRLIEKIVAGEDDRITKVARRAMMCLIEQYRLLQDQILDLDRQVMAWHRSNDASKRLATIPGIGPLAASALVASVGDASSFKNGRSFAAFIGLVPKQSSSGGKERLGKISKRGDHYLRWLLVVGSLAVIRYAQRHGTRRPWLVNLLQRRTTKIAAVAMANKIARIAWVLMARGGAYREPVAPVA